MKKTKDFFASEFRTIKNSVSLAEYIFWWVLRIAQAGALIYHYKDDPSSLTVLLLALNLLATFTVFLVRVLLFPKSFFGKLPYRCQTWLNLLIVFASFMSHGLGYNHSVQSWDKILHVMAGFFILLIGNEIVEPLIREGDRVSPLFRTLNATGFSFFAIVIWEVYEFIVDYNWPGSNNMAYNLDPDRDPFFVWLYGGRSENFEAGLFSVFDTLTDMICAIAGAIPAIIFLYFYLRKIEQKASLKEKEAEASLPEKEAVKI